MKKQPKVTGVGGIFFKCNDPEQTREWYRQQLGLTTNEYGSLFEFREGRNPDKIGYLQWSPFPSTSNYFEPGEAEFMVNYRVQEIEALVEQLSQAGVTIVDEIEEFEYGKFVHILDPDGRKVELWEPVDQCFTDLYGDKTTK